MGSLAEAARGDLGRILGRVPHGPVRMLSQVRRWGWLFNPITLFFVWDQRDNATPAEQRPIGAVLEVTNTPWKERIRYPLILEANGETLSAEFDKALHVSPFLTMDHRYEITVQDRDDTVAVDVDVADPKGHAILHTCLRLQRQPATRQLLGKSIRSEPFPTHRVSAAIHSQAARLWAKGVPVIPHPTRSSAASAASPSASEEAQ